MTRLAAAPGIVDSPRVLWVAASRGHQTEDRGQRTERKEFGQIRIYLASSRGRTTLNPG